MLHQSSVQQQILTKAKQDPSFRQRLLSNPREVLATELGLHLSSDVTIQIHEETATTLHLVLPASQQESTLQELSDEELEQAAGGVNPTPLSDTLGDGSVHIGPLNNHGYAIGG